MQLSTWIWIFGALIFLPGVTALSDKATFPDLPFKIFNKFIKENFAAEITLSQVLLVLFTFTENPDLLNLHARQKNPKYEGETCSSPTGWIKCLAHGLEEKLGQDKDKRSIIRILEQCQMMILLRESVRKLMQWQMFYICIHTIHKAT